jgi:hypothetical protein
MKPQVGSRRCIDPEGVEQSRLVAFGDKNPVALNAAIKPGRLLFFQERFQLIAVGK